MFKRVLLVAASVIIWVAVAASESIAQSREWTDSTGRYKIQAELLEVTTEGVKLRRADGSVTTVALNRLSAADQAYIQQLDQKAGQKSSPQSAAAQPPPPQLALRSTGMDRYPRRPDGTPDFEKFVLNLLREGVAPENNAAVVLWQVMGVSATADLYREIGLSAPPPGDNALESLWGTANSERIAQWRDQVGGSASNASSLQFKNALVGATGRRPWTRQSLPPFAEWLRKNEGPLSRVAAATQRSRFYWPSSGLLNEANESLVEIDMSVASIVAHSDVTASLLAAGMGRLGEGRAQDAWQAILAAFRLNRLVSVHQGLIRQGLVLASDGRACQSLYALLDHDALSAAQARDVLQDVSALSKFRMADSLDTIERAMCLDVAVRVKTGRISARLKTLLEQGRPPGHFDQLTAAAANMANYNAVLERCNAFYDRFVAIMRMPPGQPRQEAIAQIRTEVTKMDTDGPARLGEIAQHSEAEQADVISSVLISWFFRDIRRFVPIIGEDDAHTRQELAHVAAALAVYWAEQGQYPEKLDDLVPAVLTKPPLDSHHAKPFRYRREGDGYLLYGLGANGVDDAGSTGQAFQFAFEGQPLDEMSASESQTARQKIPRGADDWSIRLPRPAFDWNGLLSPK